MYGQSGPHRSSPEWRLPQEQEPHSQPPPPPPRPPALYTPATYGPISNPGASSSGTDTTAWGVRFNQHHAPPLPPRPSSTNEQPHAYLQKQPHPYSPDSGASFGTQPSVIHSTPPPYTQTPAVPPPPPKIPQGQHAPAEQYGHPARPPLLAQGGGPAAMTGSYAFRPPLVNTNTSFAGASALGPGTPSDWEHLGPSPGDFDDAAWFPPRRTPPPEELAPFPEPSSMPNGPATNASDVHFRPRTDTNGTFASSISSVTQSGQNSSNSPVSPCTSQGVPAPPAIVRVDSTELAMAMAGRTNTIDSVMDAWARPISPAAKTTSPVYADPTHRAHSVGPANRTTSPVERTQVHADPLSAERLRSPTDTSAQMPERPPSAALSKNPDPFEDLDPWSKSSLERFVAMLRKEAVADLDQERYQIFTAFMAKETKLREILYNIEHEPEVTQTPARSLDSTPQPMSNRGSSKVPIESGLIPVASEAEVPLSGTATTEDEDTDDVRSEYSSGGRPIFAGRQGSQYLPRLSKLPSVAEPATGISRTSSFPSSADVQKQVLEPLATNPPRPIYTPFQYTEGPQRGSDDLKFDRPAYQAYSDLRQAAVNGRIMSNGPAPAPRSNSTAAAISPITNERDETFLGLIRHKSVAYITPAERKATPLPLLPEALQKSRPQSLVDDLRAIVWKPLDKQSESSWHITTREELRRFSDDFSYIQQSTDRWEQAAAARRKKLDQERMLRQEESEEQIDDLFNGKSIGYADINTLEEEFRQTEARVQLEEERREVESFIDEVFNPLDEGLKNDILELRKSYDSALNQLDRDQKSKSSASERQSSPSVTMKMVNEIHNKLEIRFQKRLDIALDCERRRKKAERRPLVFMGDMPNLRKLDAEFDQMERRNILEAYKDRDDRANRLMDSFDDAILHGLGMNQSLLDEVASKAVQLDPAALRASGLSDSEIEQILKSAATFAASLLADSEAILRSSGEADMALNDADYGVSVAEARYAASDPDIFHRLADEKKKEDEKMQSELDSKLHSIQKGPKKIETMVEKLLLDLRNSPPSEARRSPVPASAPTSPSPDVVLPFSLRSSSTAPIPANATPLSSQDGDSGHKERIRRALEEAKKRNASRNQ